MKKEDHSSLSYSNYLQLDKILASQETRSDGQITDEHLFIIIHQTYELWFKQILHEVDAVTAIFAKDHIDDNSGEMGIVVHRLGRIKTILQVLNDQIAILETLTPMAFLEFRDALLPASGFQSLQFRLIEIRLGLKFEQRFMKQHYKNVRPGGMGNEEKAAIEGAEAKTPLKELVVRWMERAPFLDASLWKDYVPLTEAGDFWEDYKQIYAKSLAKSEAGRADDLEKAFFKEGLGDFSVPAIRAVLFTILYRDLPLFHMPFEVLSTLIDIDGLLSQWRYGHMLAARRLIGQRIGTGGTSGVDYLEGALQQHHIFKELSEISTFLVEGSHLPTLPSAVLQRSSFQG